eukprot:COSAG01_NODE_7509_length_3176_cov_32.916477_2_plen_74_part_00
MGPKMGWQLLLGGGLGGGDSGVAGNPCCQLRPHHAPQLIRFTIDPDTYGRYPVVSPIIFSSMHTMFTKICDDS